MRSMMAALTCVCVFAAVSVFGADQGVRPSPARQLRELNQRINQIEEQLLHQAADKDLEARRAELREKLQNLERQIGETKGENALAKDPVIQGLVEKAIAADKAVSEAVQNTPSVKAADLKIEDLKKEMALAHKVRRESAKAARESDAIKPLVKNAQDARQALREAILNSPEMKSMLERRTELERRLNEMKSQAKERKAAAETSPAGAK